VLARPSEEAVGLPAQRFLIVTDLNLRGHSNPANEGHLKTGQR
jgi:hypothetical protein